MTGFGYPAFFLLMLAIPALLLLYRYAAKRDEKARARFAESHAAQRLGLGSKNKRRYLAPALVMLALALSAAALARPLGQAGEDSGRPAAMDVILALDVSDSMLVPDGAGGEDRLSEARAFASKLVMAAPGNRYGLLVFSGDAVVTCPPTLDHDTLLTFISEVDTGRTNLPGTAMGEAMLAAVNRFKKSELPRAVVLISDGENTYGADPVKSAGSLKEAGARLFTVGVGTQAGGRIPTGADFFGAPEYKRDKAGNTVVSRLDEAALESAAEAGGGKFFAADKGSVKSLASMLTSGKKAEVKDPFRGAVEYGGWFALAAFALAVAVIAL